MKKSQVSKSTKKFKEETTMKKSRILLALTLALILCLGTTMAAFADLGGPGDRPGSGEGIGQQGSSGAPIYTVDEDNPVQAAIAKILQVPVGTDFPAMTFEFEIKAVSLDGDEGAAGSMPPITLAPIKYDGSETNTPVDGIVSITKESPQDIFKDVQWPRAGVYVYEIKEIKDTYYIADAAHETLDYSDAGYILRVYVKEGSVKGKYYIYALSTVIDVPDTDGEKGDKVDPTPGDSHMTFTNNYVKTNGGTDPKDDDDSTLWISKAVDGDFASSTVYFGYKLTVTVPSLVTTPKPYYKAYVVENGAVVTSAENGTIAGTDAFGPYIAFVSGSETEFYLRDGQRLVFVDTPVGTGYDVTEQATNAYKPDAYITYNSETAIHYPGTLNNELEVLGQLVGEAVNKADFINTRDEVTPMGVNLNDLPFIILLVLAMGIVGGYMAVKTRKRKVVSDQ